MTKDEAIVLKIMAAFEEAPSVLEYALEIGVPLTAEDYLWLDAQDQNIRNN
jgi:hypothetical protein